MANASRAWLLTYGVATVSVALGVWIRWLLDPVLGEAYPYATLFFAVTLSAWYGGFGPAVAAVILGAFMSTYFLLQPGGSLTIHGWDQQVGMTLYLSVSFGIALLGGAMRAAQRHAEANTMTERTQREQLRVTLESIGDAVIVTDAEGRVRLLNPTAQALTGWRKEEALGQPLEKVFPIFNEITGEAVESPVAKVRQTGTIVGLANHTVLIATDGMKRPIEDSGAPVKDDTGRMIGVVLVFRDTTERRQAEDALRQAHDELEQRVVARTAELQAAKERVEAILHHSLYGILLVDADLQIQETNPAVQRLFACERSECFNRSLLDLIAQEDVERVKQAVQAVLLEQVGQQLELRAIRRDGLMFDAELSIVPDKAEVLVCTMREITKRKQAEAALRTSEARYRLLADTITDVVMRWNAAGDLVYISPSSRTMLGYAPEELLGQAGFDLIHPNDQVAFRQAFANGFAQGSPAGLITCRCRHRDGHYLWLEWAGRTVTSAATGQPLEFITSARDVTERKQAEEALRAKVEEEHAFQCHLKALHEITIELASVEQLDDFYRRSVELGRERFSFERLGLLLYDAEHSLALGTYGTDAQGRVVAESHLRMDPASHSGVLQRTLEKPERFTFSEQAQLLSNFEPIGIGWHAMAVLWNGKQSLGWLVADNGLHHQPVSKPLLEMLALYSMTLGTLLARKQLEVALREQNVELEKAIQAKDRFLASMSHELRTPLNSIIGFTGTLLMKLPGPLTPDQEKQLRTVQTSAKHLLSLINDLLDLAKIEAGKVELTLEVVNGRSALEEAASILRPLAETKGLQFVVELPADEISLYSDRRALSQIILNLGNNAIKFTKQGEVRLTLTQCSKDGQQVTVISVRDTGLGIRLEDQPKLFQAFTQADSGVLRYDGTGLGLHLSQRLAALLGGQISFESEYGKGSVFRLTLPQ